MFNLSRKLPRPSPSGFTLVELMISVAMVLLIIVGINEVFRLTSDTVGAGQSLSTALRDQRAVRTTLDQDFSNIAPDSPALIIRNQAVAAFRSRDEQLGSVDPTNPLLIDLNADGDSSDAGETISPATPGDRVRRTDSITFFVRYPLRRQTGNLDNSGIPTDLLGTTQSAEAMITYGHLRLPNNAATTSYYDPAQPNIDTAAANRNDNNAFASQFVLGRQQMLLAPYIPGSTSPETAWRPTPVRSPAALNLTPLSMATSGLRNNGTTANIASVPALSPPRAPRPFDSLVDVVSSDLAANTPDLYVRTPLTLASFAQRLAQYQRDVASNGGAFNGQYNAATNSGLWFLPASSDSYTTTNARETLVYRAQANPFGPRGYTVPDNNNLATTLSQTSPVFLSRCTSFIVEYAGDFISQDNRQFIGVTANTRFGLAYDSVPDGEIDYVVYKGTRRIRWYGLPRYTNSGNTDAISNGGNDYLGPVVAGTAGSVQYNPPTGTAYNVRDSNALPDVVPLADVLSAISNVNTRTAATIAPFEKVIMTDRTVQPAGQSFYDLDGRDDRVTRVANFLAPQANYADTTPGNNAFNLQRANYITAWSGASGTASPRMIRITLTLEDPTSRSNTAQTYEYVFTLPN